MGQMSQNSHHMPCSCSSVSIDDDRPTKHDFVESEDRAYKKISTIPTLTSHKKKASVLMDDNDTMIHILTRLPLKSLLQCKTVCKWWYNLISDSVFIANYSRQNPQYHVSGIYLQKFVFLQLYSELEFIPCEGKNDAAPKPSLSFIEDEKGVIIHHSCNGLLLCSSFRCHEEDRKYYICKPTTKQYFPLPKPQCKTVFGISIAFDPYKSVHYQVICICDSKLSSDHCEIKVYKSSSGSWRNSGNARVILADMLFNRGVYWNGALHWVGRRNLSLRFDVEKERMLTMPMPPIREGWTERRLRYFGESGGHLYLIEIYDLPTTVFDVMEMRSDYSGWSVKYHVDLGIVAEHCRGMVRRDVQEIHRYIYSILHIVHRCVGDDDESFMVIHVPGDFVLYNLRDNTLMGLCNILFPEIKRVDKGLGLLYNWEGVYPYTNHLCYI